MFDKLTGLFPKEVVTTVQNSLENVNPIDNLSSEQRHDLGSQALVVATYLVYLTVLIVPLFFLPLLADAFDLPRQTLLFLLSFLAIGACLLHFFTAAKPTITRSAFDLPVFLVAGIAIISSLLSTNRFTALAADPILYLSLAIIFVTINQVVNRETLLLLVGKTFLASGSILAMFSLVQVGLSLVSLRLAIPAAAAPYLNTAFSPAGSVLSQAIFLAILLPIAVGLLSQTKKQKQPTVLPAILTGLIILGLLANVMTLFNNRPVVLSLDAGWKIATGTIGQSLTAAFFGIGPNHFLDSFTAYKPIEFNTTPFWNLRFVTSSNFFFYLLTTVGIAGLAVFIFLANQILQAAKKRLSSEVAGPFEKGLITSLILSLALFLALPAPQIALFAFVVTLGLFTANLHLAGNTKFVFEDVDSLNSSSWPRPVVTVIALGVFFAGSYFLGRLVLADYHFAKSLTAAVANQGTQTYNEQIAALQLNPWNESYRVSYSQTNLALANALAGQPNLSDQQKQTILALIQQAIREGRNAVSLEPRRASDWENLSLIYRNLINFAQGADQFAIASENQAVNFDPTNPRLRLDLGGIYFSLKDYQSAGQTFAQAVNLKPDYANAHYNLAQALKLLKLNDQALQQLQLTATLVCSNTASPDCQKVNAEVTDLGGSQTASGSAAPEGTTPLATASAKTNLPKAATKPPAKVSSPSGELTPQ